MHFLYLRTYITVGEREGLRGAAGGRVAMMLKRDREHSDWPIVVQWSDNAGNWPSLDKTAKWSAVAHSGATATLFQSRKSFCTPFRPSTHAPIPDAKLPHFSVLTAGRCIDDRARMVMQSRVVSDVSYTPTHDSPPPDTLMEFLLAPMNVATQLFINYFAVISLRYEDNVFF